MNAERRAVPGSLRAAQRDLERLRQRGSANKVFRSPTAEVAANTSDRVVALFNRVSARLGERWTSFDEATSKEREEIRELSDDEHADLVIAVLGDAATRNPTVRLALARLPAWRHLRLPGDPPIVGTDERGCAIYAALAGPVPVRAPALRRVKAGSPSVAVPVPVKASKVSKAEAARAEIRRQAEAVAAARQKRASF